MENLAAQLKSVDSRIDKALDARNRHAFYQACRLREHVLRKMAADLPAVVRIAS